MNMKKVTSALILLAMLFSLAACGGNGAGSAASGGSSAGSVATGGSDAPEGEQSEVVVWLCEDEYRFMMESGLVEQFESEYPQYTVTVVQYTWDALLDKLAANFASNTGDFPDLSVAADQCVGEYAQYGGIIPLDDFYAERGYDEREWLENSWEHFRWVDGKLYAAPFYVDYRVLFYRKDIFEQEGLEPPTTLDELMEIGQKLTVEGERYGLADQFTWNDFHFFSWLLYAHGGDFYNEDRTEPRINSPEGIAALEYYKALYDNNVMPKDAAYKADTLPGFIDGYYCMAEMGSWWRGLIASQAPELGEFGDKWDAVTLPVGASETAYGHPNGWIVPTKANNPEGGLAFLDFFLRTDVGAEWLSQTGELVGDAAVYDLPEFADDPYVQVFVEAGQRGTTSVSNVPGGDLVIEMVYTVLGEYKEGKLTAEEAAASMEEQLIPYLYTPEEVEAFKAG